MSDDFVVGQRLGDYEILGVLGSGGMGKVYKVRNVISDRVEAMKVLLANLASQKDLADRFLREIKLLAALNHPNIAPLYSALTLNDQLVMLMEYVNGTTIASQLQSGPILPADAIAYSEQILSALGYAHKMNVIHRDVKPSNMMLAPQGVVKLMDFGIARPNNELGMTLTGTTLGSLNYMSPEQVRGTEVDARSDLYSFGVSLYEMVVGQLPFQGNSNYSVMSAHVQQAPPPPISLRPDLPKGLNEIILMSMAKDPKDRFQSAEAFANALKSVLPAAASSPTKLLTTPAVAAAVVAPTPAPSAVRPAAVPAEPATVARRAAAGAAPASGGHRGLYMALGGVLVVAMLAGASVYVPHYRRAHAGSSYAQPTVEPAAEPAAEPPSAEPAAQPTDTSATPRVAAAPEPHAAPLASKPHPGDAAAQAQADAAREAQEQEAQNAAELKEAAHQADLLDARAASISQSLDTLRDEQARQGYGLRGDMAAAEQLMKTNLSRAQDAISQNDVAKAKEYLDIAAAQAEKLEHFLGR